MRPRPVLAALALAALGSVLAACGGPAQPAATHRGGTASSGGPASSTGTPSSAPPPPPGAAPAPGIVMPPFGAAALVRVTGGLPHGPGRAAAAAVTNFQLAYLYAQFKGGKDTRWKEYTSAKVAPEYQADLATPGVKAHSFRGIVHLSRVRVVRDRQSAGAYDVSGCYDNSLVIITDIRTGKPLHDDLPADEHFLRYTDVVARTGGRWVVIRSKDNVYYPHARARACKP